jgi:hypothetical protein
MFRRNISPPSLESNSMPSKKPAETGSELLLVSCLTFSSTLMMEAKCTSETLGSLRTTRHYDPEDSDL